jgi:hypothetical protein
VAAQAGRDARLVGEPDRAAAPAALWVIGAFIIRFVVLAVNVAIVWYLIAVLRRPAPAERVGP